MRRFSLTTSLLLATILALGFAPVWGFVVSSLIDWVLPSNPRGPSMQVRPDGTPLLIHMDAMSRSVFYTDLRGQPVEVNAEDPTLPWINLEPRSAEGRSEPTWRQRIRKFSDNRTRPTNWYVISDGRPQGRAYLVGYDAASKYRVGFIAKDGFRENLPPAEDCFPFAGGNVAISNRVVSSQNKAYYGWSETAYSTALGEDTNDFRKWQLYLLGNDQRIYVIDLRTRMVNVAFTAPHVEACALYSKNSKSPTFLIVRTDRQVFVLNQEHKVERTYTIPPELVAKSFRWAEVAPDQALATWTAHPLSVTNNGPESIAWFNQAGHITRHETEPAYVTAWFNTTISLACPCFVVVVLVAGWIFPYELLGAGATDSWGVAQQISLDAIWPALVFVTMLSALLSIACYRRQVRYTATPNERIAWPIFVFLGGLPVWIAYRFGRRWPVLERCPECGADVPRDRETCAACRKEFPLPERQGLEILAI